MEKRYLTSQEAAEYLRLKETTLEIWRVRGRGPRFRRAGRRVLYLLEDIEEFLGDGLSSTSDDKERTACSVSSRR